MRTLLSSLRFALALAFAHAAESAEDGPLMNYVNKKDDSFKWTAGISQNDAQFTRQMLDVQSQTWRDHPWTHKMIVVRPKEIRQPDIALMFITGDGDGTRYIEMLETLSSQAGAVAAVITRIPNQPLYDGRKEDALIAYTFQKYLETRDESWPLLFPMAKSAVRGMDAVQQYVKQEFNQEIKRFTVTGASKRGWTTWLTAAVDERVAAIAPMVIDMLNMKPQLQWAEKMYGEQSEQIADYTELDLHKKMDEPAMVEIRSWIDPYSYRDLYTMPKLILLGTNDPYWVIDSLRHYWNDLPETKLLFQTPNAGHDLDGGKEAIPTLAAFYEFIAHQKELPKFTWDIESKDGEGASLNLKVSQQARRARLWTAHSEDRDFRDAKWSSERLNLENGRSAKVKVELPETGFRSYMVEIELRSPSNKPFKLSTEARVVPDMISER